MTQGSWPLTSVSTTNIKGMTCQHMVASPHMCVDCLSCIFSVSHTPAPCSAASPGNHLAARVTLLFPAALFFLFDFATVCCRMYSCSSSTLVLFTPGSRWSLKPISSHGDQDDSRPCRGDEDRDKGTRFKGLHPNPVSYTRCLQAVLRTDVTLINSSKKYFQQLRISQLLGSFTIINKCAVPPWMTSQILYS